ECRDVAADENWLPEQPGAMSSADPDAPILRAAAILMGTTVYVFNLDTDPACCQIYFALRPPIKICKPSGTSIRINKRGQAAKRKRKATEPGSDPDISDDEVAGPLPPSTSANATLQAPRRTTRVTNRCRMVDLGEDDDVEMSDAADAGLEDGGTLSGSQPADEQHEALQAPQSIETAGGNELQQEPEAAAKQGAGTMIPDAEQEAAAEPNSGGPPESMGDAQQGQPRSAEAQIPEVGETHNQLSHQTAVNELAAPSSAPVITGDMTDDEEAGANAEDEEEVYRRSFQDERMPTPRPLPPRYISPAHAAVPLPDVQSGRKSGYMLPPIFCDEKAPYKRISAATHALWHKQGPWAQPATPPPRTLRRAYDQA
ncbi:hypothetical protein WJX74_003708, partial [Apatococcus lobatus]